MTKEAPGILANITHGNKCKERRWMFQREISLKSGIVVHILCCVHVLLYVGDEWGLIFISGGRTMSRSGNDCIRAGEKFFNLLSGIFSVT